MSITEASAESNIGRIIKGIGGLYSVRIGESVYTMNAKGIFRKDKLSPLPGDIVRCTLPRAGDDNGVITSVMPRKNSLIRPACANIDRLFIVACKESPKADLYTLDKLSAVAVKNGIEVVFSTLAEAGVSCDEHIAACVIVVVMRVAAASACKGGTSTCAATGVCRAEASAAIVACRTRAIAAARSHRAGATAASAKEAACDVFLNGKAMPLVSWAHCGVSAAIAAAAVIMIKQRNSSFLICA